MNKNETLREQMWDLCYGLLSADEVTALHKQIKSDPVAARLYAEVRLQADLVASAAKIEDDSVSLSVPEEVRKVQPAVKSHSAVGESPFAPARSGRSRKPSLSHPSYRAANWLAGLAATALVALIGYGIYAPPRHGASALSDNIVASVYANQPLQSGLTQNLRVVTTNGRGEPASTALAYQVLYEGVVVQRDIVQTDEFGEAQLSLAGSVVKQGAVLEVQAQNDVKQEFFQTREHSRKESGDASPMVVVPLAAKEEPVISDVQFENDTYQPGETFRFWVHSWRAFSNQPARPADQWKLVADNGREIQPVAIESRPEAGIVSGEFQLPADAPAGNYRLVGVNRQAGTLEDFDNVAVGMDTDRLGLDARRTGMSNYRRQLLKLRELDSLAMPESLETTVKQHETRLSMAKKEGSEPMSRSGGAPKTAATLAAPTLPAPAKAPGGAPAAGRDPAPAAAIPSAAAPREDNNRVKGGLAENGEEGLNKYFFSRLSHPDRGEQEKEALDLHGDVVVVPVPAEFASKNLWAVVSKANVPVATQQYRSLTLEDGKAKEQKFAESTERRNGLAPAPVEESAAETLRGTYGVAQDQLAKRATLNFQLPPEADGELDVTLYDQSVQPPKAVYRQLVRRANSRELNINVQQEAVAFNPEQRLHVKLTATDRSGNAVPNSYFAARIVKADAPGPEATFAPANRYSAADKAPTDGTGRRAFAPGVAGGVGDGKGVAENVADAKEGKKETTEKMEGLTKEVLDRESKLKRAQSGSAKRIELGAEQPSPIPAPAGPGGTENNIARPPAGLHDTAERLVEDDRVARDGRMADRAFSDELVTIQPAVPQEVLLASNDLLIQDAVRAEKAAALGARVDFQKWVGRAVLVTATAALLLFGLLAILHRPAQAKVWVPAMAVVVGSFAVGGVWLISGNLASRRVAGNGAIATSEAAPVEFFKEDTKPMAPTAGTLPLPAAMEEGNSMGAIEHGGETENMPAISAAAPAAGRGFGGGKPGAPPAPAPKLEAATKPADPVSRPNEPAPARFRLRADTDEKKLDEIRKRNLQSLVESAKDAAEAKKSGSGESPPKPAAAKSAIADAQRKKRMPSPALLWQPNLPANERGEAELNIQLPAEAGDYVLMVDVQGPNGVGTIQKRIPVRVPAAAPATPATPAKP